MYGFPPTPPSTGCFGIWMLVPAGITFAVMVDVSVKVCVPLRLFSKVNLASTLPRPIGPLSVMYGPGALEQSVAVTDACIVRGSLKLWLACCANAGTVV